MRDIGKTYITDRHSEMFHRLAVGECVDLVPYYEREKHKRWRPRYTGHFCKDCGAPTERTDGICWICKEEAK